MKVSSYVAWPIAAAALALGLLGPRHPAAKAPPAPYTKAERAARTAVVEDPIRTTDPDIALGNLQAQIRQLERVSVRSALTLSQRARLVELIEAHGQYTGSIADHERALALAEDLAKEFPEDPVALLTRARGRGAFHRFAESLSDLDRAAALGASPAAVAGMRAGIYQALGRYDEALAIRRANAERNPSADNLGALASVRAARGDIDDAARLFAEARWSYRDVSPFPLAFLLFDEGAMWMRHGDPERARALFEAALRRVPSYATAQCYLAEVEAALGHTEHAIALLEPLARTADDPNGAALLARILAATGRADEAAPWRMAAARRYSELVAAHPDAYADHAAEFWLDVGGPPQLALPLARHAPSARRLGATSW